MSRAATPRRWLISAIIGAVAILSSSPLTAQTLRERRNFDNGWRFHLGDVKQAETSVLADKEWREVDLPHDWSIEGPFGPKNASGTGFLPGGIG